MLFDSEKKRCNEIVEINDYFVEIDDFFVDFNDFVVL